MDIHQTKQESRWNTRTETKTVRCRRHKLQVYLHIGPTCITVTNAPKVQQRPATSVPQRKSRSNLSCTVMTRRRSVSIFFACFILITNSILFLYWIDGYILTQCILNNRCLKYSQILCLRSLGLSANASDSGFCMTLESLVLTVYQ